MRVLKECNLAELVSELLNGKTMVLPTETSYGLCCDATNQQAVDIIFDIKGRSTDKPLLVVVPSVAMAQQYLQWNDTINRLAERHWPGPLTLVGNVQPNTPLARGVVSATNTVAVRVTTHQVLKFLAESLGHPLVATSANISGAGEVYAADDVVVMFADRAEQPDVVLDYGQLPKNPPTTIVEVTGEQPRIIRQGAVVVDMSS